MYPHLTLGAAMIRAGGALWQRQIRVAQVLTLAALQHNMALAGMRAPKPPSGRREAARPARASGPRALQAVPKVGVDAPEANTLPV